MSQPPVVAPAVRKLAIVEKPVEVARFRVMVGSELFKVTPPLNVPVVPATVVGVVAPTVPLMLIDAVPVRLVTVPLDGVPSAPLKSTGAPALPVLMASAVAMPVPRPLMPVEIGMPVAFANNCVSVDLRSAVSAALWISTVSAASGTVFAV